MEPPMITNQAVITRRTAIGAGGAGLVGLLLFPGRVMAQGKAVPKNPFVVLLKGRYQPVVHGPNLGLSMVDLNDGTYSTVKIYPVSGIPGNENKAVGSFYARFDEKLDPLCAYRIPGGSIAMKFTKDSTVPVDDGKGGKFFVGTLKLDILEATGIYRSFVGGHNRMVDKVHLLKPGDGSGGADEYCFCIISRP